MKIFKIKCCDQCPFFYKCDLIRVGPIPDNCPLEEYVEAKNEV